MHLDLPTNGQCFFQRSADEADHIGPIVRLRLQQTACLGNGGQNAFCAMAGHGGLRVIHKGALPFCRLGIQSCFTQIKFFGTAHGGGPCLQRFPAVLPHHIGAHPLFRLFFLLQQQIEPFQHPVDVTVFQIVLFAPRNAGLGHMIPAADIQPAVLFGLRGQRGISVDGTAKMVIVPCIDDIHRNLGISGHIG